MMRAFRCPTAGALVVLLFACGGEVAPLVEIGDSGCRNDQDCPYGVCQSGVEHLGIGCRLCCRSHPSISKSDLPLRHHNVKGCRRALYAVD